MRIAVINSGSFIGKNLIENLKNIRDGKNRTRPDLEINEIYSDEVKDADVVIQLPGECLSEDHLIEVRLSGECITYSVPQIVGKWQEPESGVAYLCHVIANDEEYSVADENESLELLFIDDFMKEMLDALEGRPHVEGCSTVKMGSDCASDMDSRVCYFPNVINTTVGEVIEHLKSFARLNTTLVVPPIPTGSLAYKLFSMYLSYLPERKMSYPVKANVDNRGVFSELVKTQNNGQVSINIARPGNVRGQHWHNTKWEIFIVVSGHGLIQQRQIGTDKIYNFEVRGEDMRAVIMLPGYTHNIINLEDDRDLVTVMFANEQFDPAHPDTFFEVVDENYG